MADILKVIRVADLEVGDVLVQWGRHERILKFGRREGCPVNRQPYEVVTNNATYYFPDPETRVEIE